MDGGINIIINPKEPEKPGPEKKEPEEKSAPAKQEPEQLRSELFINVFNSSAKFGFIITVLAKTSNNSNHELLVRNQIPPSFSATIGVLHAQKDAKFELSGQEIILTDEKGKIILKNQSDNFILTCQKPIKEKVPQKTVDFIVSIAKGHVIPQCVIQYDKFK